MPKNINKDEPPAQLAKLCPHDAAAKIKEEEEEEEELLGPSSASRLNPPPSRARTSRTVTQIAETYIVLQKEVTAHLEDNDYLTQENLPKLVAELSLCNLKTA